MPHLLVNFGVRQKLVKFTEKRGLTLFSVVKSAVVVTLKGDSQLSQYVNQPFFLKYLFKDGKISSFVEFDDTTELSDIDEAYPIEFVLQKDVDVAITSGNAALTEQSNNSPNLDDNNDADAAYLHGIGIDTSSSESNRVEGSAKVPEKTHASSRRSHADKENKTPEKTSSSQQNKRKRQQLVENNDDDDDDEEESNSYERQSILHKQQNLEFLKANCIITAKSLRVPKVKKRRTPANKKVTTAQIRAMPHRKAKERSAEKDGEREQRDEELEQEQAVDDVLEVEGDQSGVQPLTSSTSAGTSVQIMRKPVRRWTQKKEPSLKGDKITKFMPLSPLPASLAEELKNGTLDIRKVNDFIIGHCHKIVKRDPGRGEYGVLAAQFCKAMDTLGIVNASSFLTKIQLSLSSSVRAKKAYIHTIKPKRLAKKQSNQLQLSAASSDNVENNTEEDNCDVRLRRPVINIDGVKAAIKSSIVRIEFFKTHSVQEAMSTYPYLHHCDLMIFEYCTRVPMLQQDMETNFDKALVPLASILDEDLCEATNSELIKLQVFQHLANHFTDDNSTTHPLIQLWDTSVKAISPLNNLPQGQAPAIVVLKSVDAVQSVSLTFDGEKLSTLATPTAFQCIALLMAAYYVFDCAFPSAYIDSLTVIEAVLHGTIESSFKACGGSCRRRLDLLQKLSTALKAVMLNLEKS